MLAACYDHFEGLLGSWSYLHAAVVLLGFAFVHRFAAVAFVSRFFTRPETAVVEMGGDNVLVVKVDVRNAEMKWSAGQHVFVRFLTLHPWSTHPFTIASLDASATSFSPSDPLKREMKFLIRPHSGLTARLAHLATSSSSPLSLPVLLDGPYGPSSPLSTILSGSNSALFIAGGTGISFVLPLLSALVEGTEVHAVRSVKLVWAVRNAECVEWVRQGLERVVGLVKDEKEKRGKAGGGWMGVEKLEVDIFVTRSETLVLGGSKASSSEDLGGVQEVASPPLVLQSGRPDIAKTVDTATRTSQDRLVVVGALSSPLSVTSAGTDAARLDANSLRPVLAPPRDSQRHRTRTTRHRHPRYREERVGREAGQGRGGDCVLGGEVRFVRFFVSFLPRVQVPVDFRFSSFATPLRSSGFLR